MTKQKKKRKKLILIPLLLSLFCILLSVFYIIQWRQDNKRTEGQIKEINDIVQMEEKEDQQEHIEIIEPKEISKEDPYFDYIKMNLIQVDFAELKKKNTDTVGWVQVGGTSINYPFVQTKDNSYYLNHSFDKSKNNSGWVFLDYRNNLNTLSKNTILYAHARYDKAMFGTLKNTLNESWQKETSNHVIKISTEYENSLWQIFSIYHIPTTNDYIQTDFASQEHFKVFIETLFKRSRFAFPTTVDENDFILTLSTCYGDKEKMVVHAKLIKKEKRV